MFIWFYYRLKDFGIVNLESLSKISDDKIQGITSIDTTLQDYGSMKIAVKNLQPYKHSVEQQLLLSKIHGEQRPLWKNVLFFCKYMQLHVILYYFDNTEALFCSYSCLQVEESQKI